VRAARPPSRGAAEEREAVERRHDEEHEVEAGPALRAASSIASCSWTVSAEAALGTPGPKNGRTNRITQRESIGETSSAPWTAAGARQRRSPRVEISEGVMGPPGGGSGETRHRDREGARVIPQRGIDRHSAGGNDDESLGWVRPRPSRGAR
jgi:hypothetical protein